MNGNTTYLFVVLLELLELQPVSLFISRSQKTISGFTAVKTGKESKVVVTETYEKSTLQIITAVFKEFVTSAKMMKLTFIVVSFRNLFNQIQTQPRGFCFHQQ